MILLIALLVIAAITGLFFASQLPKGYKRFNEEQAKKQIPVGIRDPGFSDLKAKMFRAGYEAGRAIDPKNKPSKEMILQLAIQAAKDFEVAPEHVDVCIERFKEGFYMGQLDAENAKGNQQEKRWGSSCSHSFADRSFIRLLKTF